LIVFDASVVVSAALKEDGVPERAMPRAEETDVFALSTAVDTEIAGVLARPKFA
jgi:predicted nucleic acid-binding protein